MATLPATAPSQPVDPAQAQGAQIPLQDFSLPEFPPQAGGLKALTLTSDIKLDEYTNLLKNDVSTLPQLPRGIESLTLELFSLGYPPGFLSALSERLPNIKSLVIYSQLFSGITAESQKDAEAFFEKAQNLRALHLLDVFARPHFFDAVGQKLAGRQKGLMFLEVNYSFRHEDEDFLTRVPAPELPTLIGPGLITCAFNVSTPDVTDDPEDPTNLDDEGKERQGKKEGVMAFNKTLSPVLVEKLMEEDTRPRNLKVLNTTLYTLSLHSLGKILAAHKGLLVLSATVELEPTEECKKELLEALQACPDLEQVEIVGNPSLQFYMAVSNPRQQALEKAFPSADDMQQLSAKCPKLSSFKANVLRTTSMGTVEWTKEGGFWKGGMTRPNDTAEAPTAP
ncbi:hypothetical protein H2201_004005 [Coniosporium apollinis]|uniref:Uncharacterized protein n=1 Tax=Coniosporium apollinis TaxID=61459 RepID=A0ABQ9NU26_9PEZI|nr:hypothetical protein H2201_004005 [Coniosporium apollinis]